MDTDHALTLDGPAKASCRKEFDHPEKKLRLALGLDPFLVPGQPGPKSFLTIWDTSEDDDPCDEGEDGFKNILIKRVDIDPDSALRLARHHGFIVTGSEIYDIFN